MTQVKRTVTDILDDVGKKISQRPNLLVKAFNYLIIGIDNPLLISIIFIT
jgi:hypothetical protein